MDLPLALTRIDPPVLMKTDPFAERSIPFPSRALDAYRKVASSQAPECERAGVGDNTASLRGPRPGRWVTSREQTRVISRERQRSGTAAA